MAKTVSQAVQDWRDSKGVRPLTFSPEPELRARFEVLQKKMGVTKIELLRRALAALERQSP